MALTVIAINHYCAVSDCAKLGEMAYQLGLVRDNGNSTDKDFSIKIKTSQYLLHSKMGLQNIDTNLLAL